MNEDISKKSFDFEEYTKALMLDPQYEVQKCYQAIENLSEDTIIRLYDSIDNFLFQEIDYAKVVSNIPMWVLDAGISTESVCNKTHYEKFKRNFSHPYLNRFIYHYDFCSIVAALQDRLHAICDGLRELYKNIPCKQTYSDDQYTSSIRCSGQQETSTYVVLNNVFVALASTFDLITKIAVEEHKFNNYDFAVYSKMKSDNCIFGIKDIDDELKKSGMLFSSPLQVKKILTYRNEYVHNGPWDLRCSIYCTSINGEPADTFILSPDMDDNGNFITSGSRNKFYSQNNKINIQLLGLVIE